MGFLSDNEQKQIISHNLNYLIDISGKDQRQISIDLDINPPTFNQWVKGKAIPSVSTLKRIAAYFGVTLSQIVNDNTEPYTYDNYMDSSFDLALISAYKRADPSIQSAVDKLLDISKAKED